MKKLKLKSRSHKEIFQNMTNKIFEGWKVTKAPRKNLLGTYVCKLEKPKDF